MGSAAPPRGVHFQPIFARYCSWDLCKSGEFTEHRGREGEGRGMADEKGRTPPPIISERGYAYAEQQTYRVAQKK